MNITEVKISPISGDEKLKAFATVTFDDCFLVRDLKIINGKKGFFVAMPSRKMKDGTFKDIAHPLNNAMRQQLETKVLEEYNKSIEEPKS
ncbi:MAG: septation regulator SpoVG [Desulfurella sp.]|jgi:stage V sporulation protein G